MPNLSPPASAIRNHFGVVSTLASIVLGGLAAGAIWCVLALSIGRDTTFLIVPLAIALAFFMRWQRYRGLRGALCAIAATLLAFAYAQYLFAAVRIAQMLGIALREALGKMGIGMALQVARANLGAWDVVWLLLACVLAAGLMLRTSRRTS